MKRLLLAEDEDVLLKVLKDRFINDGWNVTGCSDGAKAIAELDKNSKYDLIILDLVMPNKDGFAVLEHIKDIPELEEVPIIVLSNLSADDDIKRALKLGADDYYVKTQHPIGEILEKAHALVVKGHTPKGDESYTKKKEKEADAKTDKAQQVKIKVG